MRIVNFLGGLGNQMFIYALYKHLKTIYPNEHIFGCYRSGSLNVHCGLELEKVFDIKLPSSTLLTDIICLTYIFCKRMEWTHWKNDRYFTKYDIVFDGYWLDSFFYKNVNVKELFKFRNINLSSKNKDILELIKSSNSVSLHIRRGDYQNPENIKYFGQFCTDEYYNEAINIVKEEVSNPVFFVFSDDIPWLKANMGLENAFYVDENKGSDSWIDMYLMSRCKNNIIANSTFSYWAAMLKETAGIVLYPKKWYYWDNPDIFPTDWISV